MTTVKKCLLLSPFANTRDIALRFGQGGRDHWRRSAAWLFSGSTRIIRLRISSLQVNCTIGRTQAKKACKSGDCRSHRKFASASSEFCLLPAGLRVPGSRRGGLWRRTNDSLTFYDDDFPVSGLNSDPVYNSRRPSNLDGLNLLRCPQAEVQPGIAGGLKTRVGPDFARLGQPSRFHLHPRSESIAVRAHAHGLDP
jgi:hypothetical protein